MLHFEVELGIEKNEDGSFNLKQESYDSFLGFRLKHFTFYKANFEIRGLRPSSHERFKEVANTELPW